MSGQANTRAEQITSRIHICQASMAAWPIYLNNCIFAMRSTCNKRQLLSALAALELVPEQCSSYFLV